MLKVLTAAAGIFILRLGICKKKKKEKNTDFFIPLENERKRWFKGHASFDERTSVDTQNKKNKHRLFPTAGNIKNIIIEVEESNADDDEDFSFGHFSQCPSKNGEYDFSFSYHFD